MRAIGVHDAFLDGTAVGFVQVHFQDCHMEGIREFAVVFVAEQDADEFVGDQDLARPIFLLLQGDGVVGEGSAYVWDGEAA